MTNVQEIWKEIPGYDGFYKASNLGNLQSIGYGNWRPMKQYVNPKGYHRIGLVKNKKQSNFAVHRIVASLFIPNPENKPFVNHLDGIKSNNQVSNLEWCTSSENELHSYSVLGKKPSKTALGKFGILNLAHKKIEAYTLAGEFVGMYYGIHECARELKCEKSAICMVAKGKRKFHKGYIFKYKEAV